MMIGPTAMQRTTCCARLIHQHAPNHTGPRLSYGVAGKRGQPPTTKRHITSRALSLTTPPLPFTTPPFALATPPLPLSLPAPLPQPFARSL